MVKVSAKSNNIWGSKGPKIPRTIPYHGYWINTKNLENFKFHNCICYTDETYHRYIYIYLNKVFHLVKSWGVFHRVYKDVQGRVQTLKMNLNINFWPNLDHYLILQKTVAYLMHHLACHNGSKFRLLLGSPAQKSTQKQHEKQFLLVRKHLKI